MGFQGARFPKSLKQKIIFKTLSKVKLVSKYKSKGNKSIQTSEADNTSLLLHLSDLNGVRKFRHFQRINRIKKQLNFGKVKIASKFAWMRSQVFVSGLYSPRRFIWYTIIPYQFYRIYMRKITLNSVLGQREWIS